MISKENLERISSALALHIKEDNDDTMGFDFQCLCKDLIAVVCNEIELRKEEEEVTNKPLK